VLPAWDAQSSNRCGAHKNCCRLTLRPVLAGPSQPGALSAERRQLTVMFCDLVGSTALSARMDPEDLREVIGAYHRCVAETVARFGGFAARYMGDRVLVYFGYPQAHEDDAERAARAGLALIDAIGRLQAADPCRVHIGIRNGAGCRRRSCRFR
jgi:class 3 adenylate cyclase